MDSSSEQHNILMTAPVHAGEPETLQALCIFSARCYSSDASLAAHTAQCLAEEGAR